MHLFRQFNIRLGLATLLFVNACSMAAAAGAPFSARENFETHCVDCHGADGKGQIRLGRKLGARDLTDGRAMSKISDNDAFKAIKFGRKSNKGEEKMDAFADGLSDKEITELVAFVRTLAK